MEIFIENVKKHTCLWDADSLEYRDLLLKNSTWELLAAQAGMKNGREAQLLWRRLRASHREALRRRRMSVASGGPPSRQWKYESLMQFLVPGGGANDDASAADFGHDDDPEPAHFQIEEITELPATPVKSETKPKKTKHTSLRKVLESKSWKRQKKNINSAPKIKIDNVISDITIGKNDSLSDLFSSLYKKTRQMPKHLQLRVQREMFEAVCRAEEEMLLSADDPLVEQEAAAAAAAAAAHSALSLKLSPRSDDGDPAGAPDDYGASDDDY